MEFGPHDPSVDKAPKCGSKEDDESPPIGHSQSHENEDPGQGQDTVSRLTTDGLARHTQMLHDQNVIRSSVHHSSATSLDADVSFHSVIYIYGLANQLPRNAFNQTEEFDSTFSDLDSAVGSWRSR